MPGAGFVFSPSPPPRAGRGEGPDAVSGERLEYRIWPRSAHPAASILQREWPLIGAERRADIYLLTGDSERVLVKLRDGHRLEIKRRVASIPPLHVWRLALSRPFPLARSERAALAGALRLPGDLSTVAGLSPAHLLADLQAASAPMVAQTAIAQTAIAQTVRKSRLLFGSAGCRAELCRVAVGGWTGLTIALEADEPGALVAAIGALRLGTLPNRSYGEALLRLVHPHPARRGAPAHVRTLEWRIL